MTREVVGIAMNGVTGRMGYRQHLVRSILAIREQGGLLLPDGRAVWPEPVLVGRNAEKLEALAAQHGLDEWTTDAGRGARRPLGSRSTSTRRSPGPRPGHHAGRSKPASTSTPRSRPPRPWTARSSLARLADAAGIKHGVVQDKLFLPGLLKLKRLVDAGFFGRILSVRGEFGYWVFEGDWQTAQRPSLELPRRGRRRHRRSTCSRTGGTCWTTSSRRSARSTRDGADAHPDALGRAGQARTRPPPTTPRTRIFELEGGVVAQINSSWAVRVNRDELVEFQVDGTHGSAVAGPAQLPGPAPRRHPEAGVEPGHPGDRGLPRAVAGGPGQRRFDNGFKVQWEMFLRARGRRRAVPATTCGPGPAACSWPSSALQSSARGPPGRGPAGA